MKSLIRAVVAVVLVVPIAVFAQSNQSVSRAQVRAELVQLENAGYKPGLASPHYPADIQAAQAKVTAQNGSASAVGGAVNGSSASGAHAYKTEAEATGPRSVYFGGQ